MESDKPKKPVSNEEMQFIRDNGGPCHHWILGMLISIRQNDRTIKEEYDEAIAASEIENREHRPSYKTARDFLVKHADHFGLKTE